MSQVDILGVGVHRVDANTLVHLVAGWITARRMGDTHRCRQVCTVNPEFVIDARRRPDFAQVLRTADLCVADGVGILLAARAFGAPLPERVTGSDGIYTLSQAAAQEGWRVFFLGAAPGVAQTAAKKLARLYPGLQVAGCYAGSPKVAEWPIIHEQLRDAAPDLLFVAYGHPHQDYWIHAHRQALPAAVAMGVGGAFDFVAGVTTRAPRWMRKLGLEWLHRLAREPWRWRRMSKLPVFAWLVLRQIVYGTLIQ